MILPVPQLARSEPLTLNPFATGHYLAKAAIGKDFVRFRPQHRRASARLFWI